MSLKRSAVPLVLLSGLGLLAASTRADTGFVLSVLDTGASVEQTALYGFFRHPDRADLVVVSNRVDERVGRVFELSGALKYKSRPVAEFEVPDDIILADTGRLGDRDILVMFTANEAIRFDPVSGKRTTLIPIRSIYNNPVKASLPKVDFFRDVNDDGLADFVIPDFNGFRIYLQGDDGRFDGGIVIEAPPAMEMSFNNHPWYQERTLFFADMDGNGREDIVFWEDGVFHVYRQSADGSFDPQPDLVRSTVPFEYSDVDSVSWRVGEEDQSDLTARALQEVGDFNGDGLADLVTFTVESSGVFKKRTTYRLHPGVLSAGGMVEFRNDPVSEIQSDGIQFEMETKDLNDDGQRDVIVSSVDFGIGKILGALLTGSTRIDLNFYAMKAGRLPDKPTVSRNVTARFDWSSGDVFFPFVLIADVNDDRLADLLVQDGEDQLQVFEGEASEALFGRRAIEIEMALPNDPDLVELADLNNDGKQDVVMRIEKKDRANRVSVLMAR